MASAKLKHGIVLAVLAIAVACLASFACGPAGFAPQQELNSVRILATRADKPFAKPGDDVTVEMLAVDARKIKKQALKIYWLPFLCENPPADLYYACFAALAGGGDAGAEAGARDGGTTPTLPPNADITPFLKEGTKYSFKIAPDIIDRHPPVQGVPENYGLAIAFAIACAGRVRTVPIDFSDPTPQKFPIGCFDDDGNRLGAEDFVFAFTRVYVYANRTNANPPISKVTFDGKDVDLNAGVVVDRCTGKEEDCAKLHPVDVAVPDDAWELNPGAIDTDGTVLHEQVYAIYYYTLPKTEKEGKLLFDSRTGRIAASANYFVPQSVPGDGRLYVVVHDTRGGTSWADFPIYVK
jgi:hypothetical protein